MDSKHGMLNSYVVLPSKDMGPPAVINSTSLLIAKNMSPKALVIHRKRGIIGFRFAISVIFFEG